MRGGILKKNIRIIYISSMVEFCMFISVSTSISVESIIVELEDVPLLDVAVKRCDSMLLISLLR